AQVPFFPAQQWCELRIPKQPRQQKQRSQRQSMWNDDTAGNGGLRTPCHKVAESRRPRRTRLEPRVGSWSPRVGELYGEAVLPQLSRVGSSEAGGPLSRSVDDEHIAVGTIIRAQADISSRGLLVGRMHAPDHGQR